MKKKFVRIFHNNVTASLGNAMFDEQNKHMAEAPIFARLKRFLRQKNIDIHTHDISTKNPSYRNIHYDMPYPFPSNFHIWKNILLSRKNNILICTEPPTVNPFSYMKILHIFFTKVYTWNDDLIDNIKYFKFRLPKVSVGMNTRAKPFNEKKFLILVNANKSPFYPFNLLRPFGNELYSERIKAIEFFEHHIPNKLSLYGRGWNKPKKYGLKERIFGFKKYSSYKGEVVNKIKLLSNYKYCICFENLTDVPGFITEKIFDCFKAKCVSIYWGATDVEKYIPKNCFIDFRDFNGYEELLSYLNSVDENTYAAYIKNMEKFLADKQLMYPWFEDGYAKFFLENVLEIKQG